MAGRTEQRPHVAHIDKSLCDRSAACCVKRICPRDAVVPDAEAPAPERTGHGLTKLRGMLKMGHEYQWKVDESRCSGCLLCAPYCPHHAIVPKERGQAA